MLRAYPIVQVVLLTGLLGTTPFRAPRVVAQPQPVQLSAATCRSDDEIPEKDRDAVDGAAMRFVRNALGAHPEAAYSAYTPEAKSSVSSEQFVAGVQQYLQRMAPFRNLHITHRYLARVSGGNQQQNVMCGNLSNANSRVAVAVKPGPAQAYVVMEAETLNNSWAFVVWLLPEQADWQVQFFQPTISAMVGKDAADLEKMAASEKQKGHNLNSSILLVAAMQLAGRGPFLQLGIQQEIQEELRNAQVPRDLQGPPPFNWRFGSAAFKVLNIGPIGVGGKIYLNIDHEIEPWNDDKVADKKNHELIEDFAKAYPEYKSAFAGLVVRAHERGGNRGFGTVSENEKGQ